MPTSGKATSPDVSLASEDLLPKLSWETETTLSSDHLPVIIWLSTSPLTILAPNKTFTNFLRADWDGFKSETEAAFASLELQPDPYKGERLFREIVNKAAKHHIPSGRRPTSTPGLPPEAAKLTSQRDALRTNNPTSPDLPLLNNKIEMILRKSQTARWHEYLQTFDHKTKPEKLWRTIRTIEGKKRDPPNPSIRFDGCTYIRPKDHARLFNKHLTAPIKHESSKENRVIKRKLKSLSLETPIQTTPSHVSKTIRKCKSSKACGPDGLNALHLKNLGQHGVAWLTKVFNGSLAKSQIPAIWKKSIVIPLLKPGKPPQDWSSYRPVSLLCPAVKILEASILPILQYHLTPKPHQHGFRPLHSTTTALLEISSAVADGFNQKKPADRTVLVTLDLSKAFDMVCHRTLLEKLSRTSLPPSLTRWLSGYLTGRQARTLFRGETSPARIVRTGVPQGSVISPTLFNSYVGSLPSPPEGVNVVSYADDVTPCASGPKINIITAKLQPYLDSLTSYFQSLKLALSPGKCAVTLLTPDTKECNVQPHLTVADIPLKLEKHPKVLGVRFDPMFKFGEHCRVAASNASRAVNAMKALAGTDWGQDTETLLVTFKALVRPRLEYAAPVWSTVASETSVKRLQTIQNAALRVATGNHLMAPQSHLHEETQVLPVKAHTPMLATQHLLACHLPEHLGQRLLEKPPPPAKRNPH